MRTFEVKNDCDGTYDNEEFSITWHKGHKKGRYRITVERIMPELPDRYSWDGDAAITTGEVTFRSCGDMVVAFDDDDDPVIAAVPAFIVDAFRDAGLLPERKP